MPWICPFDDTEWDGKEFTEEEYRKMMDGTLTREEAAAINERFGFEAVVFNDGTVPVDTRVREKFSYLQTLVNKICSVQSLDEKEMKK